MAKSLRSKRKRKLRAVKREKLKVKEKERLEMILGVSVKDTEMKNAEKAGTDGSESTEKMEQEHHDQAQEQGVAEVGDVDMKPQKRILGKKTLKRLKEKQTLKRLGIKKKKGRKIFKW